VFEGLKARLDRLFREHGSGDLRAYAAGLREALVEARLGVGTMREAIAATERELASERKQLSDAERRGRLAAEVPDAETVAVAERFVARHRERVQVLERKLVVQRDELAIAEREIEEMAVEHRKAARPGSASIDAAWRDLEAAGAARPTSDQDRLQADIDRRMRESAVEEQLAYLKRKLKEKKGEQ
jgi:hypothetical protein